MCVLEREGEENEHMSSTELLPVRDTIIRNIHLASLLSYYEKMNGMNPPRQGIE